jgi:hypothetical protein
MKIIGKVIIALPINTFVQNKLLLLEMFYQRTQIVVFKGSSTTIDLMYNLFCWYIYVLWRVFCEARYVITSTLRCAKIGGIIYANIP